MSFKNYINLLCDNACKDILGVFFNRNKKAFEKKFDVFSFFFVVSLFFSTLLFAWSYYLFKNCLEQKTFEQLHYYLKWDHARVELLLKRNCPGHTPRLLFSYPKIAYNFYLINHKKMNRLKTYLSEKKELSLTYI